MKINRRRDVGWELIQKTPLNGVPFIYDLQGSDSKLVLTGSTTEVLEDDRANTAKVDVDGAGLGLGLAGDIYRGRVTGGLT